MVRSHARIAGQLVLATLFTAASAGVASAQQIEAGIDFGYTASEGVNTSQARVVPGVGTFNSVDITSGGQFGITVGAFIGPRMELEFLWSRQFSSIEASEPSPSVKFADQNVDNYHGNFVYNWGSPTSRMRPYAFIGLGATHYTGGDDLTLPSGVAVTRLEGATKFSTTWGGGVKFYPTPRVGFRGTLRWTPTYIKSDSGGIWCDPFYPTCWVIQNLDYSNQFAFTAGVSVRFGGH